jgi:hypothetical protein
VAITAAAPQGAAQQEKDETVTEKAIEGFENSPLKTASLGKGIFMFSGDGGNVTAIVGDGSTLLIDSGIDSRVTELSGAIFKAAGRPVTRLVNTHLLRRGHDHSARKRKKAALLGAEHVFDRLARW